MTTSASAEWARRDERGSHAALTLMRWLSLGLGRTVSRALLPFIALYFYLAAPAARRASREYLARALGRPVTAIDVLRHFHAFASTVHDRVFLLNDRFELFDIALDAVDEVDRALAAGPGAFLVGAHFGSFEVLRAATRSAAAQGRHYDVTMVMYEDNARRINAALAALNPKAVSNIIGLGWPDAMLHVQQALDDGHLVGFLADRTLAEQPTLRVPFLGAEAPFPLGAFRLAALLRRRVLLMQGIYLGGNRYRVRFAPIADFSSVPAGGRDAAVQDAARRFAAELEQACRAHPTNWFNFFDFWKANGDTPR
jgi:predicted LPLAT superfamily acyltransferase